MPTNPRSSFITRMRRKFLDWRINHEIHERLFPHHRGDRNFGYPFRSRRQMNEQTEALDVQVLLDSIEQHIRRMPKAYGESFRHILHRDLHEQFRLYEQLARQGVQPEELDPRLVAVRL
jgi:hypothetical protein